jgi:hypothetical protein
LLGPALLRATVLGAALLRAAVLLPLLWVHRLLLRVALLARLTLWLAMLRRATLLGPLVLALVLALGRAVLRLRTTGTWVLRRSVLVGHMLPRWLRWPHQPDLQG